MDEIQFRSIMEQYGQEKVLERFGDMKENDKERLLKQCDFLDFSFLNALSNHGGKRGNNVPSLNLRILHYEAL